MIRDFKETRKILEGDLKIRNPIACKLKIPLVLKTIEEIVQVDGSIFIFLLFLSLSFQRFRLSLNNSLEMRRKKRARKVAREHLYRFLIGKE